MSDVKTLTDEMDALAQETKTLIAMPCGNTMPTDTFLSVLTLERVGDTKIGHTKNTLIHDARNTLASRAIQGGYDRVLWLDSDMVFQPDLMRRMMADMDTGIEYVSALCFKRMAPVEPVIYKGIPELMEAPGLYGVDVYRDYPEDALFRVSASGFGCVMTSVDLIRRIWDRFGPPFSYYANLGEDISFCWKAGQIGAEMYCDSRIKVGHIGQMVFDEDMYIQKTGRTRKAEGREAEAECPERKENGGTV